MRLYQGDCLEVMAGLENASFDAIIADPPYGTTACKWDSVIPFAPMWEQLKRLAKPKAAIVLFGSQPFTSALVMSNPGWFKYEWVWEKAHAANFMAAKYRPLAKHENVLVFSVNGSTTYNPQKVKGPLKYNRSGVPETRRKKQSIYGGQVPSNLSRIPSDTYYPSSVQYCSAGRMADRVHPTQKPLPLMEYLVETYTNEGDTVLDFTMGSGTTGVACVKLNRGFVGIDNDAGYYAIAEKRIAETQAQPALEGLT